MRVSDLNWAEQGGMNTAAAFVVGTLIGGVKYCWSLAPGLHPEIKPIIAAEFANSLGRHSLKCSIAAVIFTTGSAVMSGLRNKMDVWNYGAGGAALGTYASFNSHKGRTVNVLVSKIALYSIVGVLAYTVGDHVNAAPATTRIQTSPYQPMAKKRSEIEIEA